MAIDKAFLDFALKNMSWLKFIIPNLDGLIANLLLKSRSLENEMRKLAKREEELVDQINKIEAAKKKKDTTPDIFTDMKKNVLALKEELAGLLDGFGDVSAAASDAAGEVADALAPAEDVFAAGRAWAASQEGKLRLRLALFQAAEDAKNQGEESFGPVNMRERPLPASAMAVEGLIAFKEVMKNIGASAQNMILQAMPIANNAIKAAMDNIAGGPMAMLAAVIMSLLGDSETFKQIIGIINPLLQAAADVVGAFLEPMLPLIQVISMVLTPVLKAFAVIASSLLLPVMQLLFPVLKFFGLAVLGLAIGIGEAWNAIAKAINWALGWLDVHLNLIDTSGLRDSFNELKDLTWDNAMAQAKAADAANNLAESLTNIPQGFRVALARFDASVPAMASGGYVPARPGGTLVRLGEGGEGEYVTPESRRGGTTIIIQKVECTDPADFLDKLNVIAEKRNIRRGAPATQYAY